MTTAPLTGWWVDRVRSPAIEASVVALFAAVFYVGLQGELPYHDAARFAGQVSDGVLVWDIAHILLQPLALLTYRATGADPILVLKSLSSLSTAVAVGLFHYLLLRLGTPRWQTILGTLILAGCCSVLTLAPSAHPKLVAFPFVNGAFLCLCLAERRGGTLLLAGGGVLLAIAAGFLASALLTAPFAALALLIAAWRGGEGWRVAFGRATLVSVTCGLTFLLIACAGYMLLTNEAFSVAGLTGSVAGKADLRPPPVPLPVHFARIVFGTVNNLVSVPGLGATIQAWMRGQIPSLSPYAGLLPTMVLWLLTAGLIAAIYVRTAWALLRERPLLMPVAFLCGAQAWTIWYGLNDPEHWFQLTAPSVLLFLMLMPARVVRWGLPAWAAIATAANLALLAIPVAVYPLARHNAELTRTLGAKDLLIMFASYPGRAFAGFYDLRGVRTVAVSLRLRQSGGPPEDVLARIDTEIDETLRQGGRVVVADILDPLDWEAPWMALLAMRVTKPQVERALLTSRRAVRLDDLGGLKLWELRKADGAPPVGPTIR